MSPEVNESLAASPGLGQTAEALSHEAECKCPACRAFWWELFTVKDERDVMTGKVEESP